MLCIDGARHEIWYITATGVVGLAAAIFVLLFSNKGDGIMARMARCSMGFTVAVVWIMAIADEVVNVLQTFGLIFGLSDAIIGLTIFAVGNSLADLVANMSVAVIHLFSVLIIISFVLIGFCPTDGLLSMLRWTNAQHPSRHRYFRLLCDQSNWPPVRSQDLNNPVCQFLWAFVPSCSYIDFYPFKRFS
jgi:hypothetical protein